MLETSFSPFIRKNPMKLRSLELFLQKTQFRPIFHCKSVVWAKSTIMTSL